MVGPGRTLKRRSLTQALLKVDINTLQLLCYTASSSDDKLSPSPVTRGRPLSGVSIGPNPATADTAAATTAPATAATGAAVTSNAAPSPPLPPHSTPLP